MKIAYFDLVAGASGDMILSALVDAGLPLADLTAALAGLHLDEFTLTAERVMRGPFSATHIDVATGEQAPARHLSHIEAILDASTLPPHVAEKARRIFRRMVEAEAGIHHMSIEEVHLHELAAVDTIVDVTGGLLALDLLGIEQVYVSPAPLGRGWMHGQHGRMPLPAPATLALLRGAPVVGIDFQGETVTPTAAALLTEVAAGYGPIPAMRLTSIGYGAGTRTTPEPNVLRVLLGEADAAHAHTHSHTSAGAAGLEVETLDLLETNIDNMNPEIYGYAIEQLLAHGALDVYLTPVMMKKNRPATVLNVLCRPADTDRLREAVFSETSTLGVRTSQVTRHCLAREMRHVDTPFGKIHVKVVTWGEGQEKAAPEYEDCAKAARTHNVPIREVYQAAMAAYGTVEG
jgi:pyridinium-3,5-bisthiocarboxylic acid mononucleotide nickel chelatase